MLLLFEHQSQSDTWMLLRLLDHILHIWKEHRREHPESRLLPAVLSVVLHHSRRGWTASVELIDLMDLSPELKRILLPYLPNFRFVLDDLTHQADETIRQRVQEDLVKLVLLLLKNLRHDADLAKLEELTSLMVEVAAAPSGVAALRAVVKYILTVTKADFVAITHLMTTQVSQEAGDLTMTTAQQLIQQGIEQGIEKGIEKGRVEGRVEKQRQTLAKLIQLRFTAPSAATLARLGAASEAELDLWTERILTAETLDDLLA